VSPSKKPETEKRRRLAEGSVLCINICVWVSGYGRFKKPKEHMKCLKVVLKRNSVMSDILRNCKASSRDNCMVNDAKILCEKYKEKPFWRPKYI
jgi:hypothetical protein